MTKLDSFVHVKSHNPRNWLLQTEGAGKSHNFLKHVGTAGEEGRAASASISCSSSTHLSRAKHREPRLDLRFRTEIQEQILS